MVWSDWDEMTVCLQIFGVKGLLGEVTVVGLRCWTATGVRAGLGRELEGCLGPSQGKPRLPAQPVPGIH